MNRLGGPESETTIELCSVCGERHGRYWFQTEEWYAKLRENKTECPCCMRPTNRADMVPDDTDRYVMVCKECAPRLLKIGPAHSVYDDYHQ